MLPQKRVIFDNKSRMNHLLKKCHVVKSSQNEIQTMREKKALDFRHAHSASQTMLLQHPGMNLYFFFKIECNVFSSLCCILAPRGHSPPTLCMNVQKNMNCIRNSVSFEALQYSWTPLSNEPEDARMFQLICSADPETDSDVYPHENYDLFLPNIRTMLSTHKNPVSVLAHRSDGTSLWLEYNKDHNGTIDQFVSEAIETHNLENTPTGRSHLKRRTELAISTMRTRNLSMAQTLVEKSGLGSIESYLDFYSKIKTAKIFPIEYLYNINPKINPFYGDADSALVISDYESLSPSSKIFNRSIALDVTGGTSAHFLLLMILLVELLSRLRRLDVLGDGESGLSSLVPFKRLFHFAESQGCVIEENVNPISMCLGFVCSAVLSRVDKVGRSPHDVLDFISNFGIFDCTASLSTDISRSPSTLRLDPENHNGLQMAYESACNSYQSLHPKVLRGFISPASAVPDIIKKLLIVPGHKVQVPPGARKSDAPIVEDNTPRSDCLRRAVLSLPESVLSPMGKTRAEESLPNNEIMFDDLYHCANREIRSINIRNTPRHTDPHKYAMSAKVILIGNAIIEGRSRSHAVVIDGTKGRRGSIFDPHDGSGEVERSAAGLKKLGITSFSQAYEIQRNEISKRKRAKLQRDTGLPFLSD